MFFDLVVKINFTTKIHRRAVAKKLITPIHGLTVQNRGNQSKKASCDSSPSTKRNPGC
jgi:hypothetical protein